MSEPAIWVQGVSFAYESLPVLENVDLEVQRGEFIGLVGPNGGGKSTLLKLILGLLEPRAGRIRVLGRPPREARRVMGYVPQHSAFPRDFPISVADTVALGRLGLGFRMGGFRAEERLAAARAMAQTEVTEFAQRRLSTLSGGQLQRVLIARALASEPTLLLLDEPTANIDQRVETDIFDLLRELARTLTIVVVSHDIGFISQYVSLIACLNRTLLCHTAAPIAGEIIQQIYGAPVRMIRHNSMDEGQ